MKFVVTKSAIEKAAKNLCRVINPKNALPILADIMCDVREQDKVVLMTASDGEVWITITIGLTEAEGGGKFCVNANSLNDAISQLTEQPVTIIADTENGANAQFRLEHDSGVTYFPIEDANEYPEPPEEEDENVLGMPAQKLVAGINAVLWTSANDELRPTMNGVLFNFEQEFTDIVASNGHCIMRYRIDNCYGITGQVIVPKKVANILTKILQYEDADDEATVIWNETYCKVVFDETEIHFRLVDGKYPNYESVTPKDQPWWAVVDRDNLMSSIKKVKPFTSDASELISCDFDVTSLEVSGDNFDAAMGARTKMEATTNVSDRFCIGMKGTMLLKALQHLPYLEVQIWMTDKQRAVVIQAKTPDHGWNVMALVMPMMLND